MMTKEQLGQIRKIKKEIKMLNQDFQELPLTKDSVKGSMPEFPYIQRTVPIIGIDEEKGERIRRTIERKLVELQEQLIELEEFLDRVEDAELRTILRLKFRNGLTNREIGKELGFDQSSISKKINKFLDEM